MVNKENIRLLHVHFVVSLARVISMRVIRVLEYQNARSVFFPGREHGWLVSGFREGRNQPEVIGV